MEESGKLQPSERRLVNKPEFYGKLFDKLDRPRAVLDLAAVQKYAFIAKQELEAVQVTGTDKITDETSVGYNWHLYGRLGLLLLSSFFEKHKQPWLDYKCHSLCAAITGYLLGPLESGVRKWVKTCMNEWFHGFLRTDKKTVFRRSMPLQRGSLAVRLGRSSRCPCVNAGRLITRLGNP